jgi:hypothetical protein
MEIESRPSYYSILPANVRYDENLTSLEKLLYSEITSLCDKTGSCWARNEYFANLFSKNVSTISRNIKKLEKKKYIFIVYKKKGNQIVERGISIINNPQKCEFTNDKNVIGTSDKNVIGYNDNNIYIKETNIINNISKEKTEPKLKFSELQNVYLTKTEFEKLKDRFGDCLNDKIETLSLYMASHNKKYASHYSTILAWDRKDKKSSKVNGVVYEKL